MNGKSSFAKISSSDLHGTSNFGSRVSSFDLNKPYSLSRKPRAIARWRITMLCSLPPVKYASANGNSLSLTTRKSHWMPPSKITLAFVSPFAVIFKMPGCETKNSITSAGFFDDASKSMSPMISLNRRKLPAALQRITSSDARANFPAMARRRATRRSTNVCSRKSACARCLPKCSPVFFRQTLRVPPLCRICKPASSFSIEFNSKLFDSAPGFFSARSRKFPASRSSPAESKSFSSS